MVVIPDTASDDLSGLVAAQAARLARRTAELFSNDRQFRDAAPLSSVHEAKAKRGLGLAQIVAASMEGYAERPALAHRASELVTDPATGRKSRRLLPRFETVTYRDVWSRVRSLASVWHHDPAYRVAKGDLVCILAFAGSDFVVVDLACIHAGAVSVPIPTTAPIPLLAQIIAEADPRCIASSINCLESAVEIIVSDRRCTNLIVIDYQPDDDAQGERYRAARQRLVDAGNSTVIRSLASLCDQGAALPPAPLFVRAPGEDPLVTIFYTSGTTGSPKGAMYRESMFLQSSWLAASPVPLICLNYMPMNHSFGRHTTFMILGNGGTCYFTAKDDLSTLFEDIRIVRPTQISFVPRICEMIFHHYQGEMLRRTAQSADEGALSRTVMAELRRTYLGGRVLAISMGAAPLAPELRKFIETCSDVIIVDGYGATEVGGIALNTKVLRPPIIDYKLIDVPELGYFHTDKPYPRGELLVKTSTLMAGYYKRPELSAAMFDEDGYYKTGDIMAEIGPDRIVYLDRRNNVLKLAQGEFVAIANLEALFASGHPLIRQAFLYGSSERSFLLAVLVPNFEAITEPGQPIDEAALKSRLRDAIKEIARREGLNPYEVPRDFLLEMEPFSVENGLLTGVGKFLRSALKARYGARLDRLYADIAENQENELRALRRTATDAPVLETVIHAVRAILGIENVDLTLSPSFVDIGGDSLTALSFSLLLGETFAVEVPVGVITNPASNLKDLARYIDNARRGTSNRPTIESIHGRNTTQIHARDLALDKFIDAQTLGRAKSLPAATGPVSTVLLTGANGFLGRFLCLEWLERLATIGGKLVCIARGRDAAAARRRITVAFDSGDPALARHFAELAAGRLEVLAGDLAEQNLGLNEHDWTRLAESVDLIVHPAALVNHVLPYGHLFGPNVLGTAELIRLAITTRLKSFVNVSTIAVATLDGGGWVQEDADIRVACPSRWINSNDYASGYASSKWAGEILLRDAHDRCGLPVTVFRSDMILAHSTYRGQLNVPDMFTRWIYSLVVTGLAPRSFYRTSLDSDAVRPHYDGLPVDFTAEAITTLGLHAACGYRTYHVLNPHDDGISLDRFVDWMIEAGQPIQRIDDYDDWLSRFETALRALPEKQRQLSSLPLIHQLREPAPPIRGSLIPVGEFHAGVRELGIGSHNDIPHVPAALIRKYLADLKHLELT